MAGAYPDLFQAGVAFSGVPDTCFSGSNMWNSACSQGQISKTPQQWVRAYFAAGFREVSSWRAASG